MGASASLLPGGFPRPVEQAEVLWGHLENGYEIVLIDTHVEHWFPGRTRVNAGLALAGWRVPEDLLFGMVEFQVGGLTELATVRPLEEIRIPMTLSGGADFAARWDAGSDQRWSGADGDEIELKFVARIDYSGHYGLAVSSSPVVRVRGLPRSAGDWMRDYVVPLAELTTLATARRQQVAWVKLGVDTDNRSVASVQVFGDEVEDQAAFDATEPDNMISDIHTSLIPLGSNGVDLAALLARWHELRIRHRTFYDYLVMSRTDRHAGHRARLMTVVPALEALHDQLHGPPPPGRDEQRRNEVLDRVFAMVQQFGDRGVVTTEDLGFLERRLAPSDGHKLAGRLKALVEHDLGAELRALLVSKVNPLPDILVLDGLNGRQSAWEAMATVRNKLGHGVTPVPTTRQTAAVVRLAHTIATALALRLLSVPDTALRAGIDHGRWLAL
jgi:hypothetical protein